MNWLNYIMVRQKGRDASSKFLTTKVIHMWNSYMPAVLSWVISLTSKSEDKEQAHSWVGDHRDAVEHVVSLLTLTPNPSPSGTAKSTALLTQNVLWELGGITHLQIYTLIIWREQVVFDVRLSPCSQEWSIYLRTTTPLHISCLCMHTHFMLCAKKRSSRYNTQAVKDCTLLWSPLSV